MLLSQNTSYTADYEDDEEMMITLLEAMLTQDSDVSFNAR